MVNHLIVRIARNHHWYVAPKIPIHTASVCPFIYDFIRILACPDLQISLTRNQHPYFLLTVPLGYPDIILLLLILGCFDLF